MARDVGARVRDWFNGGDPQGRRKVAAWARGYDDRRPEGYTFGMMGPALGLSLLAAVLYPLTKGYGSVVALALAVFLLLGRQMIERQVAADVSDLVEAERQYGRTRNPEYLDFAELRAAGMLEDNKMLTAPTRQWLGEKVEWARREKARTEERAAAGATQAARPGAGSKTESGPLAGGSGQAGQDALTEQDAQAPGDGAHDPAEEAL